MTPEQISIATSFISVLSRLGGWQFAVALLVIVIGPWILSLSLSHQQTKRFEAAVRMYEDNVDLVKKYEQVATDLQNVVILNTQTITRLVDRIDGGRAND